MFDTKLDSKGLETGIENLDSELKKVKKSTDASFGEMPKKIEGASAANKNLNENIEKNEASLDKMATSTDKTANAVENLNEASSKQPFSKLNSNIEPLQTGLKGLDSKLASIQKVATVGFVAITSGFVMAGSAGFKFNAEIEQYKTSFEVMSGSAEKATEVVEKLKKIGAETPFELPELAEVTQLLMNYGFTADDAMDKMQMLGDISQGNSEKMNRVASAYGQMSSAGKVSLEDIKQMIEAGFNPLQEISQSTGESMQSLYDRISNGTISVDEITASMQRSTSEGGKYFKSMEKQSKNVNGMLSTLSDTVKNKLGEGFSFVNDIVKDALPNVIQFIEKLDVKEVAKGLSILVGTLTTVLVVVTSLRGALALLKFMTINGQIVSLGSAITTNLLAPLSAVTTALAPIIGIALAIVAVITLVIFTLKDLWENNLQLQIYVMATISSIKDTLSNIWVTILKPIFDSFVKMLKNIWDNGLKPLWDNWVTFVGTIISAMMMLWNSIKPFIDWVVATFGPMIVETFEFVANIVGEVVNMILRYMGNLLSSIGAIIGGVVKVFSGIIDFLTGVFTGDWSKAWDGVKKIFSGLWDSLVGIVKGAWGTIISLFSGGGEIFDGIADAIGNVFKTIVNGLIDGLNWVISSPLNFINGILNDIRGISVLNAKPFKGLWSNNPIPVPQIPHLERGGVLKKGQVGLLEGNGDEAVIPLDKNSYYLRAQARELMRYLPQMRSGGVEQTLNFYQPVRTPDEFSRIARVDVRRVMVG